MSNEEEPSKEEQYNASLLEAQAEVKRSMERYLQLIKEDSIILTKFVIIAETYQIHEGTEYKNLVHLVDNCAPWEVHGMLSMISKDVWQDAYEGNAFPYVETDEDDEDD